MNQPFTSADPLIYCDKLEGYISRKEFEKNVSTFENASIRTRKM